MHVSDLVSPIASSDWKESELGADQCSLDGDLDFFGDLNAESNVTVVVSNSNDGLESGSLTGLGLFLDGHDLHDLVGKLGLVLLNQVLNDFSFLDGDRVGVDFFK